MRDAVFTTCLRVVDALAPRTFVGRPRPMPPLPEAVPGISILVPERGTPRLLAACLSSVASACGSVAESVNIVVMVNGCDPADYRELAADHPAVRWVFHARPLGYGGAIALGLAQIDRDWVYLLNSDMTVAPDALSTLLPLRDEWTFAVASQIFFVDPHRRREETGWTDYRVEARVAQHYDRVPKGDAVRGHLYAGGGSSLFRTALRRRYASSTSAYAPFYFEDADWGVQAGRAGYAVKFCPASKVHHRHRATIGQFYAADAIDRIVRRNQLLFEARHGFGGNRDLLALESAATKRELTSVPTLAATLAQRWQTRRARVRGYTPESACATIYPRPFRTALPTVLISARGALARMAGGGARRILALAEVLSARSNLVLVTEQHTGGASDVADRLAAFTAVHVVGNWEAGDRATIGDSDRYAHELAWWQCVYRPALIEIADPDLVP